MIYLVLLTIAVVLFALFSWATFTTMMILKEGKPIRELKLAQMERLKRGEFTVFFSPEHKALAEEVAEALVQSWRIVREQVGLDLGHLGVAVVVSEAHEELGGVSLRRRLWGLWNPIFPLLIPANSQRLTQADNDTLIAIYWAMSHEAMEWQVAKKLYHDPESRWIGDGLAEYVGYVITSKFCPQIRNWMLALRRNNVQTLWNLGQNRYNLAKEFLIIKIKTKGFFVIKEKERAAETLARKLAVVPPDPGYGVALAFWLQIAQKHGEGVIKSFWQRVSQRGFPNAQGAARILSELTGEDIWTKLQNMDLQEVLQTLEAAAGP